MRNEIKLALYAFLLIAAIVFGLLARSTYMRLEGQSSEASAASATEVPAQRKDEDQRVSSGYGRMVAYGAVFFVSVVGLGLLVARDVSHYVGYRTFTAMYDAEGEAMANPEYDAAEQEWAHGHHLDAINLMREYLLKNPREQHVALRIAEIYEKDLHNPLAAALEYEEVLKQKLPAERWGWAAIHLCNLYSKLNQHEKSVALLQRIESEYHETAAAEKARKRLDELGLTPAPEEAAPAPEEPATGPKLPPGFTLKKS